MDCGGVPPQWVKLFISVWLKINAFGKELQGMPKTTQIENIQVVAVEHCYKKVKIRNNCNFIIL